MYDDRPLATKKGVAIPIEQLPALIEALGRVGEAAYGGEDDPLTRQYRATMADEPDGDRAAEPNTILGAG